MGAFSHEATLPGTQDAHVHIHIQITRNTISFVNQSNQFVNQSVSSVDGRGGAFCHSRAFCDAHNLSYVAE